MSVGKKLMLDGLVSTHCNDFVPAWSQSVQINLCITYSLFFLLRMGIELGIFWQISFVFSDLTAELQLSGGARTFRQLVVSSITRKRDYLT